MTRKTRLYLLAVLLWPAFALAQSQPAATPYPEWSALTEAQRDALVAPVRERWNAHPGERARMIERAQRWQQMSPEQRNRAHHGMQRWEHMSPDKRSEAQALFHATRQLDAEARRDFYAKWRQMSAQQRQDWLKAHPAPSRARD